MQNDSRDASSESPGPRRAIVRVLLGIAKTLLILILLGGGLYAAYWFNTTEMSAEAAEPQPEAARLVEVAIAERGDHRVEIRAMGVVMPAREIVIRPRVSGTIVEQAESYVPGGRFAAGAFMVEIDPADYEQALLQRESELQSAEASLRLARAEQEVAEKDLELLQDDISDINRDLVLRVPQVNQAEAEVKSARASLRAAQLDLDRTRIAAPFRGHIVQRSALAGDTISAGDELATFVGSDRYWIELSVPVSALRWIEFPSDAGGPGSPARVRHERAWGVGIEREGRVAQLIGELEPSSRQARVIVSVADPLAERPENQGRPALLLGAYVEAVIEGLELKDVVPIDRSHLRENDTVWVMNDEDRLETRRVSVIHRGRRLAYLESGLERGERVVTTNLRAPIDGMLLRTAGDGSDG